MAKAFVYELSEAYTEVAEVVGGHNASIVNGRERAEAAHAIASAVVHRMVMDAPKAWRDNLLPAAPEPETDPEPAETPEG